MKLKTLTLVTLFISTFSLFSQVGIGTTSPNARLDITASNTGSPSPTDGLLVPRVNNFPTINPGVNQDGMIIYLTSNKTYYYWNNSLSSWSSLTGATNIDGLTDGASDNTSVFLGNNAGINDNGTNSNTGVGISALTANISGSSNSAIGRNSLSNNTSGSGNTALGYGAGSGNVSGSGNVFLGMNAGSNEAGNNKLYIDNTVANSDNALVYGEFGSSSNTVANILRINGQLQLGTSAGTRYFMPTTRGTVNQVLQTDATGNVSWVDPSAVAATNIDGLTDGSSDNSSVFLGNNAGINDNGTNSNTGVGISALTANISGSSNSAIGRNALSSNTTGSRNTALGNNALNLNTIGTDNISVGFNANFGLNDLNNTISIGSNSGGVSNVSNRIEMGNTSITWIGGQVTWSTYSDARIKTNISEDVKGLDFITLLRPVTYNLDIHAQNKLIEKNGKKIITTDWTEKYDIEQIKTTGFIAQEVEQAALSAGYDFSGVHKANDKVGMYSISYASFVVPLVKSVQELDAKNKELNKEVDNLKQQISELKNELKIIQEMIKKN